MKNHKVSFLALFSLVLTISLNSIVQAQKTNANNDPLQNYIEFSVLPQEQKTESFATASAKVRSALWRVNLSLFLVRHPTPNNSQRDFLIEMASLLKPESFENALDGRMMGALGQRALALFPRNEAAEILANLGGGEREIRLLQNFRHISRISVSERKDIFFSIPPTEKSALWRLHLGLKFVFHDELNRIQKSLILRALVLATPESFQTLENQPGWATNVREPLQTLMNEVATNFSGNISVARDVFFELGNPQLLVFEEPSIYEPLEPVIIIDPPIYEPLEPGGAPPLHVSVTSGIPTPAHFSATRFATRRVTAHRS